MILTAIFMVIAGIFNAVMDTLRFEYYSSVFSFITDRKLVNWVNPTMSQYNKWKPGLFGRKERFFGSSTFLVWLTDLWHMAKGLMILFIGLAIVAYHPAINKFFDLAIAIAAFTCTFELTNRLLLSKHK
jgi:hypothetical protein